MNPPDAGRGGGGCAAWFRDWIRLRRDYAGRESRNTKSPMTLTRRCHALTETDVCSTIGSRLRRLVWPDLEGRTNGPEH